MLTASKFATDFVPAWIDLARDREYGGVVQRLDFDGHAVVGEMKSTLAHARTVFSLSHLYLHTGDASLLRAARDINDFMMAHLRSSEGGYRYAVECDGRASAAPADNLCRAYDQSFALLALVTLGKADPSAVDAQTISQLWEFIETLTEPETGALFEDDEMARQGPQLGGLRAQNPQMHMLEALLQAFELIGNRTWLERADRYVALAEKFFIDPATGAVREFVSGDLSPLASLVGRRREPGHQYEWAWLLLRYRELGGNRDVKEQAARMSAFADRSGIRSDRGPMQGAPYNALDAEGRPTETSHLLWPLTELGKLACMRHMQGQPGAGERAQDMERLIFSRFFAAEKITWVNQLDGSGAVLSSNALSRLIYHVLLFVTEGVRAGLWNLQRNHSQ